jgi:hypothetical protein
MVVTFLSYVLSMCQVTKIVFCLYVLGAGEREMEKIDVSPAFVVLTASERDRLKGKQNK